MGANFLFFNDCKHVNLRLTHGIVLDLQLNFSSKGTLELETFQNTYINNFFNLYFQQRNLNFYSTIFCFDERVCDYNFKTTPDTKTMLNTSI